VLWISRPHLAAPKIPLCHDLGVDKSKEKTRVWRQSLPRLSTVDRDSYFLILTKTITSSSMHQQVSPWPWSYNTGKLILSKCRCSLCFSCHWPRCSCDGNVTRKFYLTECSSKTLTSVWDTKLKGYYSAACANRFGEAHVWRGSGQVRRIVSLIAKSDDSDIQRFWGKPCIQNADLQYAMKTPQLKHNHSFVFNWMVPLSFSSYTWWQDDEFTNVSHTTHACAFKYSLLRVHSDANQMYVFLYYKLVNQIRLPSPG
jgi:hypothetical protein